MRKSCILQC